MVSVHPERPGDVAAIHAVHAASFPTELEARLAPLRARLLAAREKRPAPRLDDKVLTGWNGLMIAAYADAYRVLRDEKYRRAGERAAEFLLARLRTPDGRLLLLNARLEALLHASRASDQERDRRQRQEGSDRQLQVDRQQDGNARDDSEGRGDRVADEGNDLALQHWHVTAEPREH